MRRLGAALSYCGLLCWACSDIDARSVGVVDDGRSASGSSGNGAVNTGSQQPGGSAGSGQGGAASSDGAASTDGPLLTGGSAGSVASPAPRRPVARLAFVTMPEAGVVGTPLPRIEVALQDAAGATIEDASGNVTLSLASNPSAAAIVGFASARALGGVARFGALGISAPGRGYTLQASLDGLSSSATSDAVDVVQPAFANLAQSLSGTPVYSLTTGDGALLYASTEQGIFRSGDRGATWRGANFGSVEGPPSLLSDAGNASVLYATSNPTQRRASFEFLGKTTDGGETWRSLPAPSLYSGQALQVAVDPADPARLFACIASGVWRSSDAGETWAPTALETSCQGVVFDARSPATLYAYTATYIARSVLTSTDGGDNWQAVLAPDELLNGLFSTPAGIFAASATSLQRTTDGGKSWTTSVVPASIVAGAPSDAARVYIANGSSLRVSDDAGVGFGGGVDPGLGTIFSLAVDRSDAQRVYAGTENGAFVSSDGGNTWRATAEGLGYHEQQAVALSPAESGRVLAAGRQGIFLSDDGGATWAPSRDLDLGASQIAFDPFEPDRAYACASTNQLIISSDGGASWQVSSSGGNAGAQCSDIVVTDSAVYVASVGSGVSRSRDGGATVEPTGLTDFTYALSADASGFELYAATGNGILRSTDAGDSWTLLDPTRLAFALLIDSLAPGRVFAGIACGTGNTASGSGGAERSTNSGQTWTPLSPSGCMQDLKAAPASRGIYLLSEDGLALTRDGGDTWQSGGPGLGGELRGLAVAADGQTVFVASSTGVYRSNSAGL